MTSIVMFPPAILIFLLVSILFLLLLDVFTHKDNIWLSCMTVFLITVWIVILYPDAHTTFFNSHFVWNPKAALLSCLTTSLSLLVFFYAYPDLKCRALHLNTYYILCLFSILGALTLITAGSFVTLYLGLEMMSLPLYAIIMLENKNTLSIEAAMKYIILNALASLLLLYGMTLLYSVGQTIMLYEPFHVSQLVSYGSLIHTWGVGLALVAFMFKLGVFPFHFWVPDVYQGASISGTLFISTIPKFAILSMGLLFVPQGVGYWKLWFHSMGFLSIAMGNLIALAQTNIKRLLGYASIAHMGFVFLSLGQNTQQGIAVFYLVTYTISTIAGFGILATLTQRNITVETVEDLKGLNKHQAILAFALMLTFATMAGIPPFIGFFGKLAVWQVLLLENSYLVACVSMLLTAVGAYYYFSMIKVMYFESEVSQNIRTSKTSVLFSMSLMMHALILLGLGLSPEFLISSCKAALSQIQVIHYG